MNPSCRLLLFLAALLTASAPGLHAAIQPGDWAQYRVVSSIETEEPPVATVRLTALAAPTGAPGVAWQMDVVKANGKQLAIVCVSDRYPLQSSDAGVGEVSRYLFQSQDERPVEYRNRHTGGPLLPRQPWENVLLPLPLPPTTAGRSGDFMSGGSYLGHALVLVERGQEEPRSLPDDPLVLDLDPTLTIGTSRNFRDDGTPAVLPVERPEYTYQPLSPDDYDRLIAAGHNYFMLLTAEQLSWIINRPVFFIIRPFIGNGTGYPDLLYRSNWWGTTSFYDEPAVRFGWQAPAGTTITSGEALANAVSMRARAHAAAGPRSGSHTLQNALAGRVSLGTLELREPEIPVWETYYDTAPYQFMGGAKGMIHEGRYSIQGLEMGVEHLLGQGYDPTAEEAIKIHYAFLRGGARVFGGDWGMSIYGQAEPDLRYLAMRLGYDMGARYVWFWTSDHDHHMPFEQQLELAGELQEHRARQPKRDMTALLHAADVAIVLPYGYTLSPGHWLSWSFQAGFRERNGRSYRHVPAAALFEYLLAIRSGYDADIVVDHVKVKDAGYRHLVFVNEDGSVRREPEMYSSTSPEPARSPLKLTVAPASPPSPPADVPQIEASTVAPGSITIDAALEDWSSASWFDLKHPAAGTPASADDLAGRAALAADQNNLYVAAEVQDNIHSAPFGAWDMWQGDSFQIALDPLGQRPDEGYDWDDHEMGWTLTPDGVSAFRWNSPERFPAFVDVESQVASGPLEGLDIAIVRDESAKTTRYEAALPWDRLWPAAIASGSWMGFNVVVNDADGGQGSDGPGLRESALSLTPGVAGPKLPGSFAVLRLPVQPASSGWSMVCTPEKSIYTNAQPMKLSCLLRAPHGGEIDVRLLLADQANNRPLADWSGKAAVGRGLQEVDIETGALRLRPGVYTARFVVTPPVGEPMEQTLRYYVLPPSR